MRKLAVLVLALCLVMAMIALYVTRDTPFPPLQDGDVILQTSTSNQASAILVATASPYTHIGIIKHTKRGVVVIEAAKTVKETALSSWISHGVLKRVAIYRNPNLTPEQKKLIIYSIQPLYGKTYDMFFSFDNDSIYCSELVYRAYEAAGIHIGEVQSIAELNFDNMLVKKLIKRRWQQHPICQARHYHFTQCYHYLLKQAVVTPTSIAKDKQFTKI